VEPVTSKKKYYWQIAHVPNLTMGVLKDQGASSMRIIPRNGSCFTTPGFMYMVACMTSKPVYMSGRSLHLDPPPFNDRCVAVGGLCGATCGSGQEADEKVSRFCTPQAGAEKRRLNHQASPYETRDIAWENLVGPIELRRSAKATSIAARFFFHCFIFFIFISFLGTVLGKFPGNFTDFYPAHTWEEIRKHGYVLENYGSCVSTGVSAGENKMVVFRNWLGKISARPKFDCSAYPTFAKWVDVFCDEGHREGARILWHAWTNFLDTNPPVTFLQQWSVNLQNMTWDQAHSRSPFDFKWHDKKVRKVLPVTAKQGVFIVPSMKEQDVPAGGVYLEQDCLATLKELMEVFHMLPDNLRLEPSMSKCDDVILTRKVALGFEEGMGKAAHDCFTVKFTKDWHKDLEKELEDRLPSTQFKSKDEYKKSLIVTDIYGKKVNPYGNEASSLVEKQFPLHFREPAKRSDCQVVMVYMARSKPESDRKFIDKTRELDKYLWACLRPKAVRLTGQSVERRSFSRQSEGERAPLLKRDSRERPWSSVSGTEGENFVIQEVKRCVEGAVQRQHDKFIQKREALSLRKSGNDTMLKDYARSYLQYRTVDSDWEMARFCYGEIVGEEIDADGDPALILDNPSPALLEIISTLNRPGMGLVSLESEESSSCFGFVKATKRIANVAEPHLQFLFTNTGADAVASVPANFQQEFRKKLKESLGNNQDVSSLALKPKMHGNDVVVEVTGHGKLVEPIRDRNLGNIHVLQFLGRMVDSHPCVLVKKDLLMPYAGVRGKAGGLNFVLDALQFRNGFIGTGQEGDPTQPRMLYGIFDARHQPHPDYWRHVLPKFMMEKGTNYEYTTNDQVAMVQAPQSFPALDKDEDVLDVHNGLCFNLMNVIRNRCGGVTSCGTNAVWQINATDFNRQGENAESREYFDSRTKIEDTSSTHIQFCKGKRSVYVQEKVSTGIAKLNADYLCALQRWAEGAVQLFYLQIFVDRTPRLVVFALCVLTFQMGIYWTLYGSWTKGLVGYNVFCDVTGVPTLFFAPYGDGNGLCKNIYGMFGWFLEHKIDKVIWEMAASDYMRLIDFAFVWGLLVVTTALVCVFLAYRGIMPRIVRTFIMMENISYWLTSCSIFFWLSLTLFMIIGMNPPLMFNVTHFMCFILLVNITNHCMINEYKYMGGCSELSIWRSQQAYTMAAPLYVMAIVKGTGSAWGIVWRRLDLSFWKSNEYGAETVRGVTIWVTFIWVSFALCVLYLLIVEGKRWLFNEIGDKIQKQCQGVAVIMLGLLAITVWEPFLALWGFDKQVQATSKNKDEEEHTTMTYVARMMLWWRGKAWVMRYLMDFGMPFLVLSGVLGGGVSLLMLASHATIIHSLRG